MERITAHITDDRGIYLHSEEVDFYGPQPMNAVYVAPPEVADGLVARWASGAWEVVERGAEVDPSPPPVLPSAVDVERDRRIDAGFEFEGVRYQSRLPTANRAGDWDVFSGKALEAFIAVSSGAQPGDLRWSDPGADFAWIAADNTRVPMDAQTVIELCKAASAHRSRHTFAGSDIKAMSPIPLDYTDDQWWPAA